MKTTADGYKKAFEVNEIINKLFEKNPPSESTEGGWMTFTRTVRTTLDIIDEIIKEERRERFNSR